MPNPRRRGVRCAIRIALGAFLLCSYALPAFAQDGTGETVVDGCMDDLFPGNLNCTANDVRIARALNITVTDPCEFPGDMVTFSAEFEVILTAQERHDIGLYFAVDGDLNSDGARTGTCSITIAPEVPDPPYVDLDTTCTGSRCPQPADLCGDIDDSHSPMYVFVDEITTVCIDTDGDGFLNLPNCTSWRQPGANEVCTSPTDAFPGSPSKCRCDDEFNILPIPVPPASLDVVKTASPTSVNEPGGTVSFSVSVTNTSIDPSNSVDLDTLEDDVYGDLLDVANPLVSNNTCVTLDGENIAPQETVSCSFDAVVSGNGGDEVTDVVTASGLDQRVPPNRVSGSNDATVTLQDVLPAISVDKTADPTEVLEPGADVTFTVAVTNDSVSSDPVTIDSLEDDTYGVLNGLGTCSVPQTIQAGATYTCSFTAFVGGNPGDVETDIVTAEGSDDEGNPVSASDSATVNINDVPSAIEIIKTADPTSIQEPGGDVTFTFTVNNKSLVDTVTISSLIDTIYGDLNGQGDCVTPQVIPAGGSYSCSITEFVAGNAFDSETNVATAAGVDDDGNPVSDDDDATVSIENAPPSAMLTKTASMADVTYDVVVTNTSVSTDPLELTVLEDDIYGDITVVQGAILSTTCSVPQTIPAGGSYSCSFVAEVSAPGATDTVTGTVEDDDGSAPLTPSDSATVGLE